MFLERSHVHLLLDATNLGVSPGSHNACLHLVPGGIEVVLLGVRLQVAGSATPLELDGAVMDRCSVVPLPEAHMVSRTLLRLEVVDMRASDLSP